MQDWNSEIHKAILGQGAFTSGKLKNITAKHICLASNCISFARDEIDFILAQLSLNCQSPGDQQSMETAFAKCSEMLTTHCSQAQNQLIDIICGSWKSALAKGEREKGKAAKAIQEIITNTAKLHKIIKAEANTQMLENVFREALRALSELIDGWVAGKEKDLVRMDLQALFSGIEELEFSDDITGVVTQKIGSVLLAKCGLELQRKALRNEASPEKADSNASPVKSEVSIQEPSPQKSPEKGQDLPVVELKDETYAKDQNPEKQETAGES